MMSSEEYFCCCCRFYYVRGEERTVEIMQIQNTVLLHEILKNIFKLKNDSKFKTNESGSPLLQFHTH